MMPIDHDTRAEIGMLASVRSRTPQRFFYYFKFNSTLNELYSRL
jgi:hypothetical protein